LSKGYKDAEELSAAGTWSVILGDPQNGILPADPFMIESIAPRTGTNPVTGDAMAPPGSPADANAINGHEYTVSNADDLQYACVFPLLFGTEKDCSDACARCDCDMTDSDRPVCAPNPADGGQPTLQVKAKAYPGLRELGVIKNAGEQGVVASICSTQATEAASPIFAYKPFVGSLVSTMKKRLTLP
jgi:hypothetical protein